MKSVDRFLVLIVLTITCLNCEKIGKKREILWTVAWSPDGSYVAIGGNQGDLKLFDGASLELIKTYLVKDVIISRLKWHPEQNLLAVVTQDRNAVARILNVESETG